MTLKITLIDADELAALPAETVLIVDCRFQLAQPGGGGARNGADDFVAGHIPGAVYADLDHDLADLARAAEGLGRHPLPLERAFSALLSRWGWQPGMQIASYDAAGGSLAAARLWWMLRLAGIRDAAVLDGGYAAWVDAGLPVECGEARERAATQIDLHYDHEQTIDHAGAAESAREGVLLDARAAPRYAGEVEPIDRVGGHVPGARNRPFADNLDARGRFKSPDALREEFLALLGDRVPRDVVHMCGSGVTACHNLLAMEHAGLAGSRLYPPSWSGWIGDASRPIAKGRAP